MSKCPRFEEWKTDIEDYCNNNNLSFEKAEKMKCCWNKNTLALGYYEKSSGDLLNDIPMPVVLWVFKDDSGLRFEQTEHTMKYLSQRETP